jgi:antitoxin (DNA-binding transcriptional repressor) of toxin-antitoxin stability system
MPSIRELKARLSHYIAESRAGYTVDITYHRRPVARLIGFPAEAPPGLSDFIAAGDIHWSGGKPQGLAITLPGDAKPLSETIMEDRG